MKWWTRRGSNPRLPDCEPGALPAELRAHITAFCPFFRTKSGFLKFSVFVSFGGISPRNLGPAVVGRCASISMRTVRSAGGERNMPLKKCRKRHIKYRKRKGNVRISQPKTRQGELHDSLSLPFADLGLDLWCATHAPTERFA